MTPVDIAFFIVFEKPHLQVATTSGGYMELFENIEAIIRKMMMVYELFPNSHSKPNMLGLKIGFKPPAT